mmetsp:Transcript_70711/g.118216  ORF Transcript_70711/g.118216 Transcript_70711/m.118216 type:complete len:266 (-) Transcript_70711:90-887(-)
MASGFRNQLGLRGVVRGLPFTDVGHEAHGQGQRQHRRRAQGDFDEGRGGAHAVHQRPPVRLRPGPTRGRRHVGRGRGHVRCGHVRRARSLRRVVRSLRRVARGPGHIARRCSRRRLGRLLRCVAGGGRRSLRRGRRFAHRLRRVLHSLRRVPQGLGRIADGRGKSRIRRRLDRVVHRRVVDDLSNVVRDFRRLVGRGSRFTRSGSGIALRRGRSRFGRSLGRVARGCSGIFRRHSGSRLRSHCPAHSLGRGVHDLRRHRSGGGRG